MNVDIQRINARFWEQVRLADEHLDSNVGEAYKRQPLAQDWARIAKVLEEAGEVIDELILFTGQNPRKGRDPERYDAMLNELCDVVITGILGLQHFTKDGGVTQALIQERMTRIATRVGIEVPL